MMSNRLTNVAKKHTTKLGQLNLRNSKAVGDEARNLMKVVEIDMLMV